MRSRRPGRLVIAALLASVLSLGAVSLADAAPLTARTYSGPQYSDRAIKAPTEASGQAKLWFHAGSWWGLLMEPGSTVVRVSELMPDHSWRPTGAVVNPEAGDVGDATRVDDRVHVVSRRTDGSMYYVRLTFDPAAGEYTAGTPVPVTTRGPRHPAQIVEDGAGRLWVGYASATSVSLLHSDDGGATWIGPQTLAETGGSTPGALALQVYDDRVGVLWSDQPAGAFSFASHQDGTDPTLWVRETARAGQGASDRISMVRVDGESDTLIAAVKSTRGDAGEPPDAPMLDVLVRAPGGAWTSAPVSTVGDGLDSPVLQVDTATGTLHLFAVVNGDVVTKRAPLDQIVFGPGPGSLFVLGGDGRLVAPTTTKEPVDARTGQVVLSSDARRLGYLHGEAAIVAAEPFVDPTDTTPPASPGLLQGRADNAEAVVLSWGEVTDMDQWAPAQNGVPAAEYVVLRNGREVAAVTSPFLRDEPRGRTDASNPLSVTYEVVAVDRAGNRSEPSTVTVDLPAASPDPRPALIGVVLLVLAGGAVALAMRRRRQLAGMATADDEDDDDRYSVPAGGGATGGRR